MAWIQVTQRDGRQISIQSRHIVTFEAKHSRDGKDHTTEITTTRQTLEVVETYDAVASKLLYR